MLVSIPQCVGQLATRGLWCSANGCQARVWLSDRALSIETNLAVFPGMDLLEVYCQKESRSSCEGRVYGTGLMRLVAFVCTNTQQ